LFLLLSISNYAIILFDLQLINSIKVYKFIEKDVSKIELRVKTDNIGQYNYLLFPKGICIQVLIKGSIKQPFNDRQEKNIFDATIFSHSNKNSHSTELSKIFI
jgi:hypothetical protein